MNEALNWLIRIESIAAKLYAEASATFSDDVPFSQFLIQMSLEESEHEKLLTKAYASVNQMKKVTFSLDDSFFRKIEAPLVRGFDLLRKGQLTKGAMIDILVEAEFSEWNEAFIYTIDTLNAVGEEYKKAVAEIDEHRIHVNQFISSLPDGDSFIQRARKFASSPSKRVLIVEDNHSVARMLEAFAEDVVEVVIARNGEEGIAKIQQERFDLIVSDIEMPKLNGIEMYKQAVEFDPSIASRFIFFSGTENLEYLSFVRATNTLMLPKPSPVKLVCEMMNEVLDSVTVPPGTTFH